MNLQPTLSNDLVQLVPLSENDFEELYHIASDELVWEQHPENDRYKKEIFHKLFIKIIDFNSGFKIIDIKTNNVIGKTSFYDLNETEKFVAIGYTFIDRKYWGTPYNRSVKNLMINYAFKFVDTIIFHIGESNFRSRKAVEKLGANLSDEVLISETQKTHVIYKLDKNNWIS